MNDTLRNLGKDELVELLEIYAKNLIALDGTWFQSLEREEGMDTAVRHDIEAWRRFSVSEARRIKKFLGLDERPGIEGLARALALRCQSAANVDEIRRGRRRADLPHRRLPRAERAQAQRHGVPSLPQRGRGGVRGCSPRASDDRISCECLSCFPDMTDDSCNCAWKFTLKA